MQNRYAGDVGDFIKLGLLRYLSGNGQQYRLGVNWYLTEDESHNSDGMHIGYLSPSNRYAGSLESHDASLYACLKKVVAGNRSVASFLDHGALPTNSVVYADQVPSAGGHCERAKWHSRALEKLKSAELIYLDPDNGIDQRDDSRSPKHATKMEIGDYLADGQSLVIYQHADRRRGGVVMQGFDHIAMLNRVFGSDRCIGAILCRRGSCRYFLILAGINQERVITKKARSFAETWAPHVEFLSVEPTTTF